MLDSTDGQWSAGCVFKIEINIKNKPPKNKRFGCAQLGSWQSPLAPFVSLQRRVCLCTLRGRCARCV